ncbi:hypothetical protein LB311_09440, partial [Enterobacter kobei]|nr:hypothetical protein [Enterobacter kobei]
THVEFRTSYMTRMAERPAVAAALKAEGLS